ETGADRSGVQHPRHGQPERAVQQRPGDQGDVRPVRPDSDGQEPAAGRIGRALHLVGCGSPGTRKTGARTTTALPPRKTDSRRVCGVPRGERPDVRRIRPNVILGKKGVAVMEDVTRTWCAIGLVTIIVLIAPPMSVQTQQAPSPSADLTTLFAPGGLLQDRNGDGVIDFVNARLVLGEKPSVADLSAPADLAARLG